MAYSEQVLNQRLESQNCNGANGEDELQNWTEKLLLTLDEEENVGRKFLVQATGAEQLSDVPKDMRSWALVLDSLLGVMQHCGQQLQTYSGSNDKWKHDLQKAISKAQVQMEMIDSDVGDYLMESYMAADNTHFFADDDGSPTSHCTPEDCESSPPKYSSLSSGSPPPRSNERTLSNDKTLSIKRSDVRKASRTFSGVHAR